MKSLKLAFSYGFLLWLLPFIISVVIFPIKKTEPVLFQSVMSVVAVSFAVIFSLLYFRKIEKSLREGIFLGVIFIAVSLFIDFFFFIWGPIKMSPPDYIKEIGVAYVIYPIIVVGFSLSREKKNEDKEKPQAASGKS